MCETVVFLAAEQKATSHRQCIVCTAALVHQSYVMKVVKCSVSLKWSTRGELGGSPRGMVISNSDQHPNSEFLVSSIGATIIADNRNHWSLKLETH